MTTFLHWGWPSAPAHEPLTSGLHPAVVFSCLMVDADRQVPAPGAGCWILDLAHARGPRFVVFRLALSDARATLISHLIEIGTVATPDEAEDLVRDAVAEPAAVIW